MDEIVPGFGQKLPAAIPPPQRRADKTGVQLLERNRSEVAHWFSGRTWRVVTELNGRAEIPEGPSCTFKAGHFTLDQPFAYVTPTGHRGTSGVVIQEVDSEGKDVPGSRATFGLQQLKRVQRQYPGCITNL